MNVTWYAIMGYIATALAIISYVPQFVKTTKEKNGGTLSKITFTMVFFGCSFWAVYSGLLKHDTHIENGLVIENGYIDILPGFITNTIIFFLMIPILWYVLNDKKKFIAALIAGVSIISLSFIFMFSNLIEMVPQVVKYLFVICAGSLTGLPFIPQTIRIMKDRKIGDFSLSTVLLIIISNIFWVMYWGGMIGKDASDGTVYLSTFFSFMALATNLPTLYIHGTNHFKGVELRKK